MAVAPLPAPMQRKTGMEWFYELLDVEYGINVAVGDARRCTTWQAALFSFVINVMLLIAFALVWMRYDLWSTATVFLPVRENIMAVVPEEGQWEMVRWIIGLILGVASAFFTSLIQWAYARWAAKHRAALWGLMAACLFDIATDYIDVSKDFPVYFKSIIAATAGVSAGWWLVGAVAFVVASFIWSGNRSLYWVFALACGACLFTDPTVVISWIVIFVGTIFASFAAQSLVLIHAAKCIALLGAAKELRAADAR